LIEVKLAFGYWIRNFLWINLASVADLQNKYAQDVVLNLANHPKITYSVTPKSAKRSGQRFAQRPCRKSIEGYMACIAAKK